MELQPPAYREENTTEQSSLMKNDTLSESASNLIGRVLYKNSVARKSHHNSEVTCSICLEEMDEEEGNLFTVPDCSHTYHKDCLARWKLQSKTCPCCRGLLPEEIGPTLSRLQNIPSEEDMPDMTCLAIYQNIILIVPYIAYPLFLFLLFVLLESTLLVMVIVLLFFVLSYVIFSEEDNNIFSCICLEIILCIIFPFLVCCLVGAFLAQLFYVFYRTMRFYANVLLCKIRWKDAFKYIIGRTSTLTTYWVALL